eukprot:jgi/Pico_ML_1/54644/g533.t1
MVHIRRVSQRQLQVDAPVFEDAYGGEAVLQGVWELSLELQCRRFSKEDGGQRPIICIFFCFQQLDGSVEVHHTSVVVFSFEADFRQLEVHIHQFEDVFVSFLYVDEFRHFEHFPGEIQVGLFFFIVIFFFCMFCSLSFFPSRSTFFFFFFFFVWHGLFLFGTFLLFPFA